MGNTGNGASTGFGEHIRRHVVGYVALFFAITGVGWAAQKIESQDIARDAVRSKQIKNDRVTGLDVNETSLDAAVLQRRVAGGCEVGESIRAIAEDGAVTCEADDVGEPPPPPEPADLSQLSASNLSSGTVPDARLAPDVSRLGQSIDSAEISSQMGVYSGRVNDLPTISGSTVNGGISGLTDGVASSVAVRSLSPAVPITISGLRAALTAPPGSGNAYTFQVFDDNIPVLSCAMIGAAATSCQSSAAPTIAPGSEIWVGVSAVNLGGGPDTFPPGAAAMFGMQVR